MDAYEMRRSYYAGKGFMNTNSVNQGRKKGRRGGFLCRMGVDELSTGKKFG